MIFKQLCCFSNKPNAARHSRVVGCCSLFIVTIGMILLGYGISPLLAEEHRHHDAHEHGVALLNVAIEDNKLYVEFHSPAANIVGFEHYPRTKAQKDAVKAATAQLKDAEALFLIPPKSQCRLVMAEVKTDIEPNAEHDADSDTGSGHDENHHGRPHKEDETQAEGHRSDDHKGERHSEFSARYQFMCKEAKALTHMTVGLFKSFPTIERIEVQQLVETRQSAIELSATKNRLTF